MATKMLKFIRVKLKISRSPFKTVNFQRVSSLVNGSCLFDFHFYDFALIAFCLPFLVWEISNFLPKKCFAAISWLWGHLRSYQQTPCRCWGDLVAGGHALLRHARMAGAMPSGQQKHGVVAQGWSSIIHPSCWVKLICIRVLLPEPIVKSEFLKQKSQDFGILWVFSIFLVFLGRKVSKVQNGGSTWPGHTNFRNELDLQISPLGGFIMLRILEAFSLSSRLNWLPRTCLVILVEMFRSSGKWKQMKQP